MGAVVEGVGASSSTAAAAVDLATAGHPVFPVWGVRPDGSCHCPDGAACRDAGKHPLSRAVPHGCLEATDDVARVEAWWRQHPQANVGLATGRTTFVVDCDVKPGVDGRAELQALAAEHGGLPETARVRTGSGGAHYYFAADPDVRVRSQQDARLADGRRLRGVDVRGDGGYVVVPPSRHASGSDYTWEVPLERLTAPPPWLLQLLAGPPAAPGGRTAATRRPGREVTPAELERIRSALEYAPPDTGREDWVERISMPLHDAFGGSEEGFQLWHAWCRRGIGRHTPNGNPAYGGEDECRRVWDSFSAAHRNPKGVATLYELAARYGWPGAAPPPGTPRPADAPTNGHAAAAAPSWQPPPMPGQWDAEELAASAGGAEDPGPFPASVVAELDGPIVDLVRWVQDCGYRRDPAVAFAAALAVTSAALGRRVVGPARTRPMLVVACLAPSGAGKDAAVACAKNAVACTPGLLVGVLDDSPTHRAQLDELLLKNRGQALLAVDEYGHALRRWLSPKDSAHSSMSPVLRRLAVHGQSVYGLAPLSRRHPARAADPDAWDAGIFAPAVTLVGFATPGQFYEALSESSLVDGFLGRHLIVASAGLAALRDPTADPAEVPTSVREWLASVARVPVPAVRRPTHGLPQPPGLQTTPGVLPPPRDPTPLPWADDGAAEAFADVARTLDAVAAEAFRTGDESRAAVLARLPGQVATLALVFAAGGVLPVTATAVCRRHVDAALRVARWSADHLAWKLRHGTAHDDVGRAHVRLREAIDRAGGRKVYLSAVSRWAWLAPHAARLWRLVLADPRYVATERWARLRDPTGQPDRTQA